MREGDAPVKKVVAQIDFACSAPSASDQSGSMGVVPPRGWRRRCPIVDTWWQTETGATLIAPLPGAIDQKPGSATLPFFGVQPAIVDGEGKILDGALRG